MAPLTKPTRRFCDRFPSPTGRSGVLLSPPLGGGGSSRRGGLVVFGRNQVGHFPASYQGHWARARSPKPVSDLKQKKKRKPAVSPFEVAGSWPKRAGWRPEVLLIATFWPMAFPGCDSTAQFFAPAFIWAEAIGPSMAMPRLKCGKRRSAWTWPFSVPDGFYRK